MSSLTHRSHVFLLPPWPLAPSTTNLLQEDTQSSTLLRSRCPNHLNLPRLTTSATQLIIPRRLHKSSLHFLSFKDTPHIHLTIIRSVLSKLLISSAFTAQVSVPYIKTLWTQALYRVPTAMPQWNSMTFPWLFHDFSMTFPWLSMPFSMTISHVWNVKYTKNVAITTTRALTHLHFMYEIEAFNIEINEIVLAWTFLSEQTSKSWNVIKNIYCKI